MWSCRNCRPLRTDLAALLPPCLRFLPFLDNAVRWSPAPTMFRKTEIVGAAAGSGWTCQGRAAQNLMHCRHDRKADDSADWEKDASFVLMPLMQSGRNCGMPAAALAALSEWEGFSSTILQRASAKTFFLSSVPTRSAGGSSVAIMFDFLMVDHAGPVSRGTLGEISEKHGDAPASSFLLIA